MGTSEGLQSIHSLFGADGTGNAASGKVTLVWAFNEATGKTELQRVNQGFIHDDPQITQLVLQGAAGPENIITTPEHPFYTHRASHWVTAGELQVGDKVREVDGTFGTVTRVNTVQTASRTCNLEVDQAHTFFVGTQGWLVHNAALIC